MTLNLHWSLRPSPEYVENCSTHKHTQKETIMSNPNPYELRFQIFNEARNVLTDEYWAKVNRREVLIETGGVDTIPEFPTYPTMQDIMERVKVINEFVSNS
jgi:hypothetical protein